MAAASYDQLLQHAVVSELVGRVLGLLRLERLELGRGGGQLDELAVDLVRVIGEEVGIGVGVGLGLGVGVGLGLGRGVGVGLEERGVDVGGDA